MIEYQYLLDDVELPAWLIFSTILNENDEDPYKVKEFCRRFWLENQAYISTWLPIQREIFHGRNEYKIEQIFRENFQVIIQNGCSSIDEDLLELTKKLMSQLGNTKIVLVQNNPMSPDAEFIRLMFDKGIKWHELLSGSYLSAYLFEVPVGEFFIFSEDNRWGIYSSNDADYPFYMIGFVPLLEELFTTIFKPTQDTKIINWLKPIYPNAIW